MKTQNVGRNDPCPCNSGKKYKKCCLIRTRTDISSDNLARGQILKVYKESLELDALSNSVTTLIKQGQIEKAMSPNVSWIYKYQRLTDSYVPYFLKVFRGVL